MNRIIHILLIAVFMFSAPLMGAEAYNHGDVMGHHGGADESLTSGTVMEMDNSGLLASMDECLKVFHCSSPNTLISFLSEQETVSFYQHALWSLHTSKALLAHSPTVDLRPPRIL